MGTAVVKVVFLGDGSVGKTALVRRFCENRFDESRVMTIGVDFQVKEVQVQGKTIKLSIWDVAGQERFQFVRENFYRGSQAAALVYDCSNPQSFEHLQRWVDEISVFAPKVKFILVANKQDLGENPDINADAFAKKKDIDIFRTSALTGDAVEAMFIKLAELALGLA
ncbi:MAG: GTP-binding protein [Anaerolineaceae bacterium]|nr:GTP-binding protein [Anaerolineaceae bacterium]